MITLSKIDIWTLAQSRAFTRASMILIELKGGKELSTKAAFSTDIA